MPLTRTAFTGIFLEKSPSMLAKCAAGLLVLPGAGDEHRHVDLVDEGRGGQRVVDAARRTRCCLDRASTSGDWSRNAWFAAHVVSPLAMRSAAHFWPAGCASAWRSWAHWSAKPSLKMPPGMSVAAVSSMTDSGVIAARCGGACAATKSCVMPGYEMPTIPTLPPLTHGCAATVSIAS